MVNKLLIHVEREVIEMKQRQREMKKEGKRERRE